MNFQVGLLLIKPKNLGSPSTPLLPVEQKCNELLTMIASLPASGDTALYDAVIQAVEFLQSTQDVERQNQARIQTIIVLSDGKDTSSTLTLYDITQLKLDQGNPIFIFPIAYGSGADIAMLIPLAHLSTTKVFSGDPAHIEEVFAALSSTQSNFGANEPHAVYP